MGRAKPKTAPAPLAVLPPPPNPRVPGRQRRAAIDWPAIEADYRRGMTRAQLEAKYDVAGSQISRRKAEDQEKDPTRWQRDNLQQEIAQATAALDVRHRIGQPVVVDGKTASIVLAAAELNRQVIESHRADLRRAKGLAAKLLAELEAAMLTPEQRDALAVLLAGEDADPLMKASARSAVEKLLGLGARVQQLQRLTEALQRLHAGEREAYGIREVVPENPAKELTDVERSARLLAVLERAKAARAAATLTAPDGTTIQVGVDNRG